MVYGLHLDLGNSHRTIILRRDARLLLQLLVSSSKNDRGHIQSYKVDDRYSEACLSYH